MNQEELIQTFLNYIKNIDSTLSEEIEEELYLDENNLENYK